MRELSPKQIEMLRRFLTTANAFLRGNEYPTARLLLDKGYISCQHSGERFDYITTPAGQQGTGGGGRMKLIYIAGAYSAPTQAELDQNITNAARAAELLIEAGQGRYGVFCPHTHSRGIGAGTEAFWREFDIEVMKRFDGVVFITDWQASKGARKENQTAGGLLIPKLFMGELTIQLAARIIQNFDCVQAEREFASGVPVGGCDNRHWSSQCGHWDSRKCTIDQPDVRCFSHKPKKN